MMTENSLRLSLNTSLAWRGFVIHCKPSLSRTIELLITRLAFDDKQPVGLALARVTLS